MTKHIVGELDLTVVRPPFGPDRQSAAQRFVAEVIDRAGNELDRRFPGRVFAVRSLSLRWTLRAGELSSPGAIERYARELAAVLEDLPEGWSRSPEAGEVQVFRDRSLYWAAYVRMQAGADADRLWAFDAIASGADPLVDLAGQGDAKLTQDVLRIVAEKDLRLLSTLLSVPAAELILIQLGLVRSSNKPVAAGEKTFLETAAARLTSVQVPAYASARVVLAFAYLLTLRDRFASTEQVRELAARLAAWTNPATNTPVAHARASPEESLVESPAGDAVFTSFGGLFYLLNVLLELNAGEILWKACVDERVFFRRMFLAIAGEGDPAIGLLSGANRDIEPAATSDQCHEIVTFFPAGIAWIAAQEDPASRITAALANAVLGRFTVGLELHPSPSLEELRSIFGIRGRLIADEDELHLLLPMEAIDMRVRRAGLDRDPGWAPWLERKVRIIFDEAGAEL